MKSSVSTATVLLLVAIISIAHAYPRYPKSDLEDSSIYPYSYSPEPYFVQRSGRLIPYFDDEYTTEERGRKYTVTKKTKKKVVKQEEEVEDEEEAEEEEEEEADEEDNENNETKEENSEEESYDTPAWDSLFPNQGNRPAGPSSFNPETGQAGPQEGVSPNGPPGPPIAGRRQPMGRPLQFRGGPVRRDDYPGPRHPPGPPPGGFRPRPGPMQRSHGFQPLHGPPGRFGPGSGPLPRGSRGGPPTLNYPPPGSLQRRYRGLKKERDGSEERTARIATDWDEEDTSLDTYDSNESVENQATVSIREPKYRSLYVQSVNVPVYSEYWDNSEDDYFNPYGVSPWASYAYY